MLVGLGAAALVRELRAPIGVTSAAVLVLALVAWNLTHLPPPVHPDGGFPRAQAAADRVDQALTAAGMGREGAVEVRSLPDFKSPEAIAYPLRRIGRSYTTTLPDGGPALGSSAPTTPAVGVIVLCDQLFREAIGTDCGGSAEDALMADQPASTLLDRFEVAPGRWVSTYAAQGG